MELDALFADEPLPESRQGRMSTPGRCGDTRMPTVTTAARGTDTVHRPARY